jgi:serine/threonine-protein kinase
MSLQQRYQIVSRIAAGGMAEVYRGESAGIEGFRKKVAIKRVLPKLSANQEFIDMFLDEARLCAYLNHSRCVQVFDIGQGAGSHFIVMELVDGADLKEVLDHLREKGQSVPVEVACLIALQICEGLAYAHSARDHAGEPLNIVHRDISPHNVLMTRFGEVKLVDFGLAKASSHLSEEDEDIVKGKFGYLAPEITLGKGADHRVDIFATGILLWEMLAGKRLFLGNTDLETFKQVRAAEIPDLRTIRSDVNDAVHAVVSKALSRERDARYPTGDAMARDLGILLTQLGKSVTYQEVAQLVRAAADERARVRKAESKVPADLIGDLILQELHGFSDTEQVKLIASQSPPSPQPPADFIDPSSWGLGEDVLGDFLSPNPQEPEEVEVEAVAESPVPSVAPAPPVRRPPRRAPAQRSIAAQRAAQHAAAEKERAVTTEVSSAGEAGKGNWWKRWW